MAAAIRGVLPWQEFLAPKKGVLRCLLSLPRTCLPHPQGQRFKHSSWPCATKAVTSASIAAPSFECASNHHTANISSNNINNVPLLDTLHYLCVLEVTLHLDAEAQLWVVLRPTNFQASNRSERVRVGLPSTQVLECCVIGRLKAKGCVLLHPISQERKPFDVREKTSNVLKEGCTAFYPRYLETTIQIERQHQTSFHITMRFSSNGMNQHIR